MSGDWTAVASADHVRIGQAGGFMQVCHGKAAPLRRVKPGSRVVYYSPTQTMGGHDKQQASTALGIVRNGEPYEQEMAGGFRPFRLGIDWAATHPASIHPLLERMEFSAGVRNWGQKFRYGLFAISNHDMDVIADAMGAGLLVRSVVRPA